MSMGRATCPLLWVAALRGCPAVWSISHHKHVDVPSAPAVRRARMHETPAKFDLNVVYVLGKDNTVADCFSRWDYQAGKAGMDISMHGDAEETAEAKRIIEAERLLEEGETKCFVVMGSSAELAQV